MFLVYINDIINVVRHCKIHLFADDTCLFIEVDNRVQAANMLNEDLASINDWADHWLVNFNAEKSLTLTIGNKTKVNEFPDIMLNNKVIKNVQHHKHLGLTFSHNLRWSAHINEIALKASKRLDLMKSLKFKLDRK